MDDRPKLRPRKRSTRVALTLMATTSLTLVAGCGREEEPPFEAKRFTTVQECVADGSLSEDQCRASYEEALAEHGDSAPRYEDKRGCETAFGGGRCEQHTGSTGSFWTPFFMGWVASSLVDRALGPRYHSTPIYQPHNDRRWYTPTGTQLRQNRDGSYRVSRRAMEAKPPKATVRKSRSRTGAVSRGGFTRRSSRSYGG